MNLHLPILAVMVLVMGCSSNSQSVQDILEQRSSDYDSLPDRSDTDVGPLVADLAVADSAPDGTFEVALDLVSFPTLRIPGEWEPQAATWMQWPTKWEATLRPDFARIIGVVQQYQPVHLLVQSAGLEENARQTILEAGGDPDGVAYHVAQYDNSWLRDNGPVYVTHDGGVVVQDWGFDGWGGNFGSDVPFAADDAIPAFLANLLAAPVVDYNDYILERGNLEANGAGTLILGWDCQLDRNPGWDKAATESLFAERLGATRVIWAHGHDPLDGTTGHIDGTVRFVDEHTVAVARWTDLNSAGSGDLEEVAKALAHAGFDVVRIDIPGDVNYRGELLPAMYMNWLVGNGFVAAMAFGNDQWDQAAKDQLETLFPGRTVHMIETLELWYNGGGIHCVTNDQPL